jgi:hypothetical protein
MKYEIEYQQQVTNESQNLINAVQTARDMLASWRNRMGAHGTIAHRYNLSRDETVDITSSDTDHVTARHTTEKRIAVYEFDAASGHLTVDIEMRSGEQPPQDAQAVMLYDDLGRLLFEADVQERG